MRNHAAERCVHRPVDEQSKSSVSKQLDRCRVVSTARFRLCETGESTCEQRGGFPDAHSQQRIGETRANKAARDYGNGKGKGKGEGNAMNILTVNLVFSTLVFWVAARIYILPKLEQVEHRAVLLPILLLHSLRHLGLMFLAPGATYAGIPSKFAYPAALVICSPRYWLWRPFQPRRRNSEAAGFSYGSLISKGRWTYLLLLHSRRYTGQHRTWAQLTGYLRFGFRPSWLRITSHSLC